ncbi:hypothetical protein LIA77_00199 [Sarocladium implicatum]|nr:hypothetical protein LIA77_00199 [Sarocladium implicatum]
MFLSMARLRTNMPMLDMTRRTHREKAAADHTLSALGTHLLPDSQPGGGPHSSIHNFGAAAPERGEEGNARAECLMSTQPSSYGDRRARAEGKVHTLSTRRDILTLFFWPPRSLLASRHEEEHSQTRVADQERRGGRKKNMSGLERGPGILAAIKQSAWGTSLYDVASHVHFSFRALANRSLTLETGYYSKEYDCTEYYRVLAAGLAGLIHDHGR